MEVCADIGGCFEQIQVPPPKDADRIIVGDTTFVIIPETEYTVSRKTLYQWSEIKKK